MANKTKQRARALQAKTGMSYSAARHAVEGPKINLIHSFRWETDPTLKFSEKCPSCGRWIY